MKKFRVGVKGRNCLVRVEGEVEKLGFMTYRSVEANDPRGAGRKAVSLVKKDLAARTVKRRTGSPKLSVDSVEELSDKPEGYDVRPGFVWFKEKS